MPLGPHFEPRRSSPMTDFRDVLERKLERLTPPRIHQDGLQRRRDRKIRTQRVTAAVVAIAVSLLAAAGLIRAFSVDPNTGDRTGQRFDTNLSVVDVRTGRAYPLAGELTQVYGLRNLSVSPDGSSLAFVGKRTVAGPRQLFVSTVDGSDVRQLTFDDAVETMHPSWSSDGTQIVYEGYTGGSADLFVVDVATGEMTRLTEGLGATSRTIFSPMPTFTHAGDAVMFTRSAPRHVQLWIVPSAGVRASGSLLRSDAGLGEGSPDGTQLAFRYATGGPSTVSIGGIYVANTDGSDPVPLERPPTGIGGLWNPDDVSASAPRWSPDGSELLALGYHSRRGPLPIRVIDVPTGTSTLVGRGQEAAWLDDDTLIVRGYEVRSDRATPTPS